MSNSVKNLLRAIAFLLVFCFVYISLQNVIVPKRDWPLSERRMTKSLRSMYVEDADSFDYICIGSSFVFSGISPMEIYRNTSLRGYIIAGPGQRAAIGYYLLRSAMKKQSPKVVLADVGSLFKSVKANQNSASWQSSIDALPFTYLDDRVAMASELASIKGLEFNDEYIQRSILPLLYYHSNYKLTSNDYLDIHEEQVYHRKGYVAKSTVIPSTAGGPGTAGGDDDDGGDAAEGEELEKALAFNKTYYQKIVDMCRSKDCEFVFIKVPVNADEDYDSNWSMQKHDLAQQVADELGVQFLDLNYLDTGLDWETDTADAGAHLNLRGANKISAYLADWMVKNCRFDHRESEKLTADWDYQLNVYDWEMDFYKLQMEGDMIEFLRRVREGNNTLLVATCGGVGDCWTDELQAAYAEATGSKRDLREERDSAYVAISKNGKMVKEKLDAVKCAAKRDIGHGVSCALNSVTDGKEKSCKIEVNGAEMSSKGKGIRFVVYNHDLGCVVDSVTFNTQKEGCEVSRANLDYTSDFHIQLIDYTYKVLKEM